MGFSPNSFEPLLQSRSLRNSLPHVELCPWWWRLALSCTGPGPGTSSVVRVICFGTLFPKPRLACGAFPFRTASCDGPGVDLTTVHQPLCGSSLWETSPTTPNTHPSTNKSREIQVSNMKHTPSLLRNGFQLNKHGGELCSSRITSPYRHQPPASLKEGPMVVPYSPVNCSSLV